MEVKGALTTCQVPPQFLEQAMLTGCTPLKALASDPRLSYNLYIPPSHYNPDPKRSPTPSSHPSYSLPRIPLVVTIHGTGRDVSSCRRRLMSLADSERFAILAPLFPAGLDDEVDLDSYKVLRSKNLKSDLALLDMVNEVRVRYPGIDADKFFLAGFSGGGQFVQRFLYVHPERVVAASVGAPGRTTRWDEGSRWPRGVENLKEVFGVERSFEETLELLRRVKVQMVVGGDDQEVPSDEFNDWNAKMRGNGTEVGTLEPMKTPRVETLRLLNDEWRKLGIDSFLDIVEGVKHIENGVNPAIERFLRPLITEWWSSREI